MTSQFAFLEDGGVHCSFGSRYVINEFTYKINVSSAHEKVITMFQRIHKHRSTATKF